MTDCRELLIDQLIYFIIHLTIDRLGSGYQMDNCVVRFGLCGRSSFQHRCYAGLRGFPGRLHRPQTRSFQVNQSSNQSTSNSMITNESGNKSNNQLMHNEGI